MVPQIEVVSEMGGNAGVGQRSAASGARNLKARTRVGFDLNIANVIFEEEVDGLCVGFWLFNHLIVDDNNYLRSKFKTKLLPALKHQR